jgi:23S rRNA (cytosine1962-C5)-methyltransferase
MKGRTMVEFSKTWTDYACIDAGNGEKLERWGNIILRRPDPQAIWPRDEQELRWQQAQAQYHRSNKGGGSWQFNQKLPKSWTVSYKHLTFKVSPTDFKHTGLFPEQAANWDWMSQQIQQSKQALRILNLFAYTGAATMACAAAGAHEVVHLDASKGMIAWAKENQDLSQLNHKTIRYIIDDALKFVQREHRRGRTYHGIVLDPPSYGRGPNNELWKLEDSLFDLLSACQQILDQDAVFFLVNAYTTGISSLVLNNILHVLFQKASAQIECGELGLPIERGNLILPCGIFGRVRFNEDSV